MLHFNQLVQILLAQNSSLLGNFNMTLLTPCNADGQINSFPHLNGGDQHG